MKHINITSHKGGVGTTVVAISLAYTLAGDGHKVAVVDPNGDARACVGVPSNNITQFGVDFYHHIGDVPQAYDYIVSDNISGSADKVVTVVTNEYLCLRHSTKAEGTVVLRLLPDRVLSAQDVAAVMGRQPIIVREDEKIARAVDAGLLYNRLPSLAIAQPMYELANELTKVAV